MSMHFLSRPCILARSQANGRSVALTGRATSAHQRPKFATTECEIHLGFVASNVQARVVHTMVSVWVSSSMWLLHASSLSDLLVRDCLIQRNGKMMSMS